MMRPAEPPIKKSSNIFFTSVYINFFHNPLTIPKLTPGGITDKLNALKYFKALLRHLEGGLLPSYSLQK